MINIFFIFKDQTIQAYRYFLIFLNYCQIKFHFIRMAHNRCNVFTKVNLHDLHFYVI
jgi:hypothetical protein